MFAAKNELLTTPSGGYRISRSLRFRSSATAYLNRSPSGTSTSRRKFTYSVWMKRGSLGVLRGIFWGGASGTNDCAAYFTSSDKIDFFQRTGGTLQGYITTSAVFRDPSSWYSLVFVYDSDNATATDRMQLWVNGVRQSVTVNNQLGTGVDTWWGTNVNSYPNYIGLNPSADYFDGYMAEVNFIDGQPLTPSSFGAYDTNGVWQPKAYTGTYGTNGFYLPFTDTTGSVGGNDTYAKVLLHGDGANNSTSILDSSWSNRKTFTAAGGAKISTTQSKFGGSSIYFDGANNTAVTCPSNADLNPSGDFTIDCWVYFTSSSTAQAVVIKTDSGGVSPYLIYTSGTSLIYYASSNNSSWDIISGTSLGTFSLNTWTHIAIVRSGNTYYGFVNGVRTTLGTSSLTPTAQTSTFRLGHYTSTLGVMSGYIDEFRFSNGIARWTADFSSSLPTRYTGYIGADTSNNYNDWDAYSISTSSGTTYDSMIDSPTNYADGGNGRGNYATFNPVVYNAGSVSYIDGNLKSLMTGSTDRFNIGTIAVSSGKWYWEITIAGISSSSQVIVGITKATKGANGPWVAYGGSETLYFQTGDGWVIYGSVAGGGTGTISNGDVIGVALDMDTNYIYIYQNNTLLSSKSGSIATSVPHTLFCDTYTTGSSATLNCGQQGFKYTPPSGFSALNTQNLPAPALTPSP